MSHILKACHICIAYRYFDKNYIYLFLNLFWISMSLSWKIWAGCSRLSANIGIFSNLAFLTQILHFVFVSAIFAVCLLANLNIIPQSGSRGGKIAGGDSKQQLDNTNTNCKIFKFKFRNTNFEIKKLKKSNLNITPQSSGRGGKIAVGDSKQQLYITNINWKIFKFKFKNSEILILKLRNWEI